MSPQILWAIPASMLYTGRDQSTPDVQLAIRGLNLLKEGNLQEAERLAFEALEVARQRQHTIGEGIAALLLSNIYWGTSRVLLARDMARKARDAFKREKAVDQRHNEAIAFFNLGIVHHLLGNHFTALNEYYLAQKALAVARQHWVSHNRVERVIQCDQLEKWIRHLTERLITSDPRQRNLTLFLPIGFADGATATLWGEYARDASVLLDGRTLTAVPLQDPLVLTADCCVFPIPPQVWQEIQPPSGQTGEYALTHPGDPLPGDPFYIAADSQGITQFIRQSDGKVVGTLQGVRIIGGTGQRNYRPIALLI